MESDGVLSVMSCLTLPPVEYECAEGDDECRLERQEKKRRATLRKKKDLSTSHNLSFHPGQNRSCDAD